MKIFKNKLIACIAALCVFTSGISVLQAEAVEAAVKQVNAPGEAVRDGKFIYYAYEMHGIRMGIMRYATKKKANIDSLKMKNPKTDGLLCTPEETQFYIKTAQIPRHFMI